MEKLTYKERERLVHTVEAIADKVHEHITSQDYNDLYKVAYYFRWLDYSLDEELSESGFEKV